MEELLELQSRLVASRGVWKKRQAEAMKGGDKDGLNLAKGVIHGLTVAIREIGILLKVELA